MTIAQVLDVPDVCFDEVDARVICEEYDKYGAVAARALAEKMAAEYRELTRRMF